MDTGNRISGMSFFFVYGFILVESTPTHSDPSVSDLADVEFPNSIIWGSGKDENRGLKENFNQSTQSLSAAQCCVIIPRSGKYAHTHKKEEKMIWQDLSVNKL